VGRGEPLRDVRAQIAKVAEGNPLFVGEVIRMLVDDGVLGRRGGRWVVVGDLSGFAIPPTIQALLAARLDRLAPEERAVIQRASVIGRVFWWQEIHELCPEHLRAGLTRHLHSLTTKELIEPDRTPGTHEDTFRFTHILVRDAAYNGIPKAERADLHERFAAWMERSAAEHLGEYEEIRGYHFEQAYLALRNLGPAGDRSAALAQKASATLAEAGGRAFARGDMPAAVSLLTRARALLRPASAVHAELSLQLAFALLEVGDFKRLDGVLDEASRAAASRGDTGLRTHVTILRLWERLSTDPEGWADVARAEAEQAIAAFAAAGDDRGLARGWSLLGLVHNMNAHLGPAEEAWLQAAEHARLAGEHREELESLSWVPLMVMAGPTHVDQGLPRCLALLDSARGDKKATASVLTAQAVFVAGLDRIDEARELIGQARELLQEMGLTVWLAGPHAQFAGWIELLAGDAHAAESELRWGYRKLGEIGEVGWLSTVVALLAEAVYADGRYDEAEELSRIGAGAAGTEDVYSQVLWRCVRAKVLARRDRPAEALALAAEATTLAGTTDFLHLRWHAEMSCAEVRDVCGDPDGAAANLREAVGLAGRKGNVVAEARARHALMQVAR
jgi:tetratricopeptide (TPR) repeat protein